MPRLVNANSAVLLLPGRRGLGIACTAIDPRPLEVSACLPPSLKSTRRNLAAAQIDAVSAGEASCSAPQLAVLTASLIGRGTRSLPSDWPTGLVAAVSL
eukprot:75027-Prorocentrum_minimum.AAC.1